MLHRLYVGANNETGKCELTKLKAIVLRHFDAFTFIKACGCWKGNEEPSVIIEIDYSGSTAPINALIKVIKEELAQESVGHQILPSISFV